MPSPKHVDQNDKGRRAEYGGHGEGRRETAAQAEGQGRRGIALDLDDQAGSYLSPSRLLSNMGISNIRDYLPSSPSSLPTGSGSGKEASRVSGGGSGSWEEADLKDGKGRRPLLLLSSPSLALQVFALSPSVIPSDSNVQEDHPAPEEIISVPNIVYSSKAIRSSLSGEGRETKGADGGERIICARLLDQGKICAEHGTVALLLTMEYGPSGSGADAIASVNLLVLSLRTGKVVRKVHTGSGTSTALAVSSKAIVISISHPTPSLHLLSPSTLEPLHGPITDLPADPRTCLPIFTTSGRLLAYATSESPSHPGPDRLGSIVTSKSLSPRSPSHTTMQATPIPTSSSSQAVLNSAVGIGGGVARGVWAGIKMGAQAASRATNGRLATSAPTHGSMGFATLDTPAGDEETESRSLDDSSSVLDEAVETGRSPSSPETRQTGIRGGEWIKVVDLQAGAKPRTIAHFKLPHTRPYTSLESRSRRRSDAGHSDYISHLAFSPDGIRLFAAPADGRSFHLLDIHPASPAGSASEGEVWHMYELRRGNSAAAVSEVQWSQDGRWVGVATGRGTVHVFAVNPSGGPPTAHGHVTAILPNPRSLSTLSTVVTPSARLRMRMPISQTEPHAPQSTVRTTFTFGIQRQHPFQAETSCLDVSIYRSTAQQLDRARLIVSYPTQHTPKVQLPERQVARRASALTEMMKARVGMGSADFDVSSSVKVTWGLPVGDGSTHLIAPSSSSVSSPQPRRSLAMAEIQTFSTNPQLLPATIYLSHQVDFYDARPIDEYSRLSIMDREARTRRLHFRPEVEIRSSTPESGSNSFNEPLTSAIHSVIESSPSQELPHLPNGYGHASRTGFNYVHGLKSSIPIAQVKQGVGHLRRGYAHRRPSFQTNQGGVSLSFEEDAVFAHGQESEDGDSPLSSASGSGSGVPVTDLEGEGDEEWGVKWEDEYSRAVEEEGGPDDLVLGLMDEQQEERKRWVERQKKLAREYAK